MVSIYFSEEPEKEIKELLYRACELCMAEAGVSAGRAELSVSFVSEERIRELNRDWRGADSITDVLSFPQLGGEEIKGAEMLELGDIVICRERAEEQAEEYGHSYRRELVYLFVHGMFHLLGFDHMNDEERAAMRKMEENVMSRLGITRESV